MVIIVPRNCCVVLDRETHTRHRAQHHHVCIDEDGSGGCTRIHTYGTHGCEITYKRLVPTGHGVSDYPEWLSSIPNCCKDFLGFMILSLIRHKRKIVYLQINVFDDSLLVKEKVTHVPHPRHDLLGTVRFDFSYFDRDLEEDEEESLSSESNSVDDLLRSSKSKASTTPEKENSESSTGSAEKGEEQQSLRVDMKKKTSASSQSGVKRLRDSIGLEMRKKCHIQSRGDKLLAQDLKKTEPLQSVSSAQQGRVKRSVAPSDHSVLPSILTTLEAIKAISSESHVISMVEGSIAYIKSHLP